MTACPELPVGLEIGVGGYLLWPSDASRNTVRHGCPLGDFDLHRQISSMPAEHLAQVLQLLRDSGKGDEIHLPTLF
jgi:hypothetical protein